MIFRRGKAKMPIENEVTIDKDVYHVSFNSLTINEKNKTWTIDEKGSSEILENPQDLLSLREEASACGPDFRVYECIRLEDEYVVEKEPILSIQKGNPEVEKEIFKKVWIGSLITAPKSGILKWHFREGDEIRNGDRLFSIFPVKNEPNENLPSAERYNYLFNRYDIPESLRVKIKDIWHPADKPIYISSWLVAHGDYIEKDKPILRIKCGNSVETYFTYDILSKADGYIDIFKRVPSEYSSIYGKICQNGHLYSLSKSKERKFYNKHIFKEDEFTKDTSLIWEVVGGLERPYSSEEYTPIGGFQLTSEGGIDVFFIFNNCSGRDYLVLFYFSNEIKLTKKDKISFLFESETILEFEFDEIGVKLKDTWKHLNSIKTPITVEELDVFANDKLKKWRIQFSRDQTTINGAVGNQWYVENEFVVLVQGLVKEYKELINDNIENYQPLHETIGNISENNNAEECFVYLMVDTSNHFHKIGISNKPGYREKTLQSEKPTIELITAKEYPSRQIAESIEKALHQTFADKRIRGEWFELNDRDINEIKLTLK
jgi:Meiotically Up-regulated Gene 113 (MUG113) protein